MKLTANLLSVGENQASGQEALTDWYLYRSHWRHADYIVLKILIPSML